MENVSCDKKGRIIKFLNFSQNEDKYYPGDVAVHHAILLFQLKYLIHIYQSKAFVKNVYQAFSDL